MSAASQPDGMKTLYQWQTEDEHTWDSEPDLQPAKLPHNRNRSLLFISILLLGAVVLLLIFLHRRAVTREEIVVRDVIATSSTLEQAITRNDVELFTNLLSRDDLNWFMSQRRLFLSDRMTGRDALGLKNYSTFQSASHSVELNADWREAKVSLIRNYEYASPEGSTQIVSLEQTYYFRLKGVHWLYASPGDDYWGEERILSTEHLYVSYPSRDEAIVRRIVYDLEASIADLCVQSEVQGQANMIDRCGIEYPIALEFDASADSLIRLVDPIQPALFGRTFTLPAPSLVGLPTNEISYQALFRGYTDRILTLMKNNLEAPIPLPEQTIAALCFPSSGAGLSLFTYDPSMNSWTQENTDRRYNYLQPLANDDGLILRGGFPGTNIGRLQLAYRQDDQELLLFEDGNTELSARLVGITSRPQDDLIIIRYSRGNTGRTIYEMLRLQECLGGNCAPEEVAGFPVWSPTGELTLITQDSDLNLYLGDDQGHLIEPVGRAFNPFWLNSDTFGYIRLLGNDGQGSPEMELVLQTVSSDITVPLISSRDLLQLLDPNATGSMRIQHVAAIPPDGKSLFLAGSSVGIENRRFFLIKLTLEGRIDPLTKDTTLAQLEIIEEGNSSPVGDPLVFTPTGYRPFSITKDGRKILTVYFDDPVMSRWLLRLYDIERDETQVINLNFPRYPAPFPYYDWSGDNQWLLLVDNGYLRLVAPDYGYERLITHGFAACRYAGWINP
jgi:hypothetical protein